MTNNNVLSHNSAPHPLCKTFLRDPILLAQFSLFMPFHHPILFETKVYRFHFFFQRFHFFQPLLTFYRQIFLLSTLFPKFFKNFYLHFKIRFSKISQISFSTMPANSNSHCIFNSISFVPSSILCFS